MADVSLTLGRSRGELAVALWEYHGRVVNDSDSEVGILLDRIARLIRSEIRQRRVAALRAGIPIRVSSPNDLASLKRPTS